MPHVSRKCRKVPVWTMPPGIYVRTWAAWILPGNWKFLFYFKGVLLVSCFSFCMSTVSSDTSNSCTFSVSSLDLRSLHLYPISCLLENKFATRICPLLGKSTLIGQMKISHGIASHRHTLWLYCMTVLVYHWMTRGKHIEHANIPQFNFLQAISYA